MAVIPDIHGHLDALQSFLRAIGPAGNALTIVQLGDFIDRGPESRACLELLMRRQARSPASFRVLKGNHEDMCVKAPAQGGAMAAWISNGGAATLKSYGADFDRFCRSAGAHHAWMDQLPLSWEHQGVLFCHAGLSPNNVKDLSEMGLLWDRPPLTRGPFRAVVCGHSPTVSAKVEHELGVFRCDLGLGHRDLEKLEYLELDIGPEKLEWKIIRV